MIYICCLSLPIDSSYPLHLPAAMSEPLDPHSNTETHKPEPDVLAASR